MLQSNHRIKKLCGQISRASLGALACLAVLTACQTSKPASSEGQSWPGQMQGLKAKFMAAMNLAFDNKRFYDEGEAKANAAIIHAFGATAHMVDSAKAKEIMGPDPMVQMTLANLKEHIALTEKSFGDGHKSYAQSLLRHSVNACVQCHTRSKYGPEFFDEDAAKNLNVDPLTKADVLTATRNIGAAKQVLEKFLIEDGDKKTNPFFRDRAIKKYMALTLRLEEKPLEALEFLKRWSKVAGLSGAEKTKFAEWEKSLGRWVREDRKAEFKGLRYRENDANSLFESTMDMSEARYIDHLREAVQLHKKLKDNTVDRAKAYLALGDIYDQLSETTYWELPEVYFEACIRERPKSLTAKSCFHRYQSRLIFGYTGSSGTFIPAEEVNKLNKLRAISGF